MEKKKKMGKIPTEMNIIISSFFPSHTTHYISYHTHNFNFRLPFLLQIPYDTLHSPFLLQCFSYKHVFKRSFIFSYHYLSFLIYHASKYFSSLSFPEFPPHCDFFPRVEPASRSIGSFFCTSCCQRQP